MSVLSILEIVVALIVLFAIMRFLVLRVTQRKKQEPKLFEPDLELVDKPDLISKIPENETAIPDSNSKQDELKRA